MADPKTYTEDEYNAMIAERDALKANRDQVLSEAKAAKKKLADYEGVDPVEFKRLKDAAADAEQKKALAEGDFKTLREQLVKNHTDEMSAKDKRASKLEQALNRRLVQDELRKGLVGKADPSMMELLVEHGSKFVKVRETEDDFEHYVADEKGNQQFSDGKATPMTIDSFVEQSLKAKFPGAFLGTGSSGGGASKSAAGSGGSQTISGEGTDFMKHVGDIAAGKSTVQVL